MFNYVSVCIVFDHVGKWWVCQCIMCFVLLIMSWTFLYFRYMCEFCFSFVIIWLRVMCKVFSYLDIVPGAVYVDL